MTIRNEDIDLLATGGGEVRTSTGDKIGKIGQVYLDDESGDPSWVTVKTGLFGMQESFVPLTRANVEGADVVVPYDKETIKGAPRVDTDGSLTPTEEKRLYSYYLDADTVQVDRDDSDGGAAHAVAGDRTAGLTDRDGDGDRDDDRDLLDRDRDGDRRLGDDRDNDRSSMAGRTDDDDRDRDRPSLADRLTGNRNSDDDNDDDTDDQIGKPRLRKYIVTEKVVSVSREELPGEDADRT